LLSVMLPSSRPPRLFAASCWPAPTGLIKLAVGSGALMFVIVSANDVVFDDGISRILTDCAAPYAVRARAGRFTPTFCLDSGPSISFGSVRYWLSVRGEGNLLPVAARRLPNRAAGRRSDGQSDTAGEAGCLVRHGIYLSGGLPVFCIGEEPVYPLRDATAARCSHGQTVSNSARDCVTPAFGCATT
jgi:hypothetical protein